MDPTQNPPAGGQPQKVDLTGIEKMIGDLSSNIETKMGEVDTKVSELANENAELKKYITESAKEPETKTEQPGWQPKSWDDFPQLVEQKAQEIVDKRFQTAVDQNKQITEEQQRVQSEIDGEIDNQLERLTKEGILPTVTNARDPNDPGNQARKELLALGVSLETPNLERVAHDVLVPAHQEGRKFDVNSGQWLKTDAPLPGRYAPVGSSSSRTTSAPTGPTYDVIRKARNMDELIGYADQHGYGPAPTTV